MSDAKMAAASDAARALVMKDHRYKTDNEQLTSVCSCGVTAPTVDIGRHIEDAASKAGQQAADAVDPDA